MTDKEKLKKIKKLADAMYYAAFNLTTDASLLRKAMKEYRQFIIHEYHKEEPVNEEWIEELTTKLDSLSKEDFKKVWGKYGAEEKEEPISEELEKIVEEIAEPTILNAYGTKELARRLRNTICGTSVNEDLELTCKDIEKICLIAKESHKFYGFWSEIVYDDILKRFKKLREEKL